MYDGGAVLIFHGVRVQLEPLQAIQSSVTEKTQPSTVTLREAVDVDAVGAGSLLVVVGHLEVDVTDENTVVVVEVAVPELRSLKVMPSIFTSFEPSMRARRARGNAGSLRSSLLAALRLFQKSLPHRACRRRRGCRRQ